MELTEQQMHERVEANNKVVNAIRALEKARMELWELEKNDTECSWRNTKSSYWKDICSKYDESKLLNCYGDIFLIEKTEQHYDRTYIGRRVLWNLGLSEERYEITEIIETDSNGEYDYTDYEIRLYEEEE